VPDGICTTHIHKCLKERDRVTPNGPYGQLFLCESDRDIVFLARESVMAPINLDSAVSRQHLVPAQLQRRRISSQLIAA